MSHFSMKEVQEEKKVEPVSYPCCRIAGINTTVVHFSESLRLYSDGFSRSTKSSSYMDWPENQNPAESIEIDLESQGGTEFPRVHKGPCGVYLVLDEEYDVKIEFVDGGRFIGNVQKNSGDGYPLPKGTKTKIIVTNHPDPEKRFTVTIEETKDWLPLKTANGIQVERNWNGVNLTTRGIKDGLAKVIDVSIQESLIDLRDVLNRVIAENEAKCSS